MGQEIAISHEEHLKNLYIISCRTRPGGGVRPGMTSVFLTTISSQMRTKHQIVFPQKLRKRDPNIAACLDTWSRSGDSQAAGQGWLRTAPR